VACGVAHDCPWRRSSTGFFEDAPLRGRKAVGTETAMRRVTNFAPIAAFSLTLLAADANHASAQSVPTLRVVAESATVRTRPALLGEVVAKAKAGTMLETLDLDSGWYWVILPPNEEGTRLPGWIREHDV